MAIPAMALLQQHDARRDIVIEPAARRRAAIEARGHSELGRSELGSQSGHKNPPAFLFISHFFQYIGLAVIAPVVFVCGCWLLAMELNYSSLIFAF